MSKTYRLGIIGFAHMHVNGLIDSFAALSNVEWVAWADTHPAVPSISEEPDQIIEGDALPEGRTTLAEEFIHHLETGDPLHPTLDMHFNLEAMAILDAGIRSASNGRMELVNDATWCIG